MKNHLNAHNIQDYLDKKIEDDEVISHLSECEKCKQALEDQAGTHQRLLDIQPRKAPLYFKEMIFSKLYQGEMNNPFKWVVSFGAVAVLVILVFIIVGIFYEQPVTPAIQSAESGSYIKNGISSIYNYISLGLGWMFNQFDVMKNIFKNMPDNSILFLSIALTGLIFCLSDWLSHIRISRFTRK